VVRGLPEGARAVVQGDGPGYVAVPREPRAPAARRPGISKPWKGLTPPLMDLVQ
jgi:hypothetical protein